MLTSDFLKISGSLPKFPGKENFRFAPSVDANESSPPNFFGKQSVLEKFQINLATLPHNHFAFHSLENLQSKSRIEKLSNIFNKPNSTGKK